MAATPLSRAELEELKKLYQDVDGLTRSAAEAEANRAVQLGNALQQLARLRKEYHDLTSDITTSLGIFHQITQEISKQNLNPPIKIYGTQELFAKINCPKSKFLGIKRLPNKYTSNIKNVKCTIVKL